MHNKSGLYMFIRYKISTALKTRLPEGEGRGGKEDHEHGCIGWKQLFSPVTMNHGVDPAHGEVNGSSPMPSISESLCPQTSCSFTPSPLLFNVSCIYHFTSKFALTT